MTLVQKIKAICAVAGISEAELARRIGTTPQNLHQRIKVGRFTQEEMEQMAAAVGAEFKMVFRFPDGTEL